MQDQFKKYCLFNLKFFCLQLIFQVYVKTFSTLYKGFKRRPSDPFSCFQKKVKVIIVHVFLQVILNCCDGLIMELVYGEMFVVFNEEFGQHPCDSFFQPLQLGNVYIYQRLSCQPPEVTNA